MDKIKCIDIKIDIWDAVSYIEKMLCVAIGMEISDVHVEPTKDFLLFRFRKDGDFIINDRLHIDNISSIITRFKSYV